MVHSHIPLFPANLLSAVQSVLHELKAHRDRAKRLERQFGLEASNISNATIKALGNLSIYLFFDTGQESGILRSWILRNGLFFVHSRHYRRCSMPLSTGQNGAMLQATRTKNAMGVSNFRRILDFFPVI